ncbi:VanZ family protein [Shouchella patagoniensis]|uniref:VanZ family protein n=1 Tax=Shouchella patagoniensis TaxID=228576 RepID=UPI000994ACDA|nr:VanZ family protein [Shouchella patagoniensis]
MVRLFKIGMMVSLLGLAVFLIAFSSSTPYANQDMRGLLNRLPLSWLERTFIADISFTYGGRQIGIAHSNVESFIEFFLRKGAHFFSFMVIGVLSCRLIAYFCRLRIAMMSSFFIVFLYAIFDEYRQSLVPDRTPLVEDVILDTIGGIVGIFVISLWVIYKKKKPSSKTNRFEPSTRMERRRLKQ